MDRHVLQDRSALLTLSIRRRLHATSSLSKCVCEVDVSFSNDSAVEGWKLADHFRHGLLEEILLFALLYILFTDKNTNEFTLHASLTNRSKIYLGFISATIKRKQ